MGRGQVLGEVLLKLGKDLVASTATFPWLLWGPVTWRAAEHSQGPAHRMLSGAAAAARFSPFLTVTVPWNYEPHMSEDSGLRGIDSGTFSSIS